MIKIAKVSQGGWTFVLFACLLAFAWFWGVVSFQHYIPSGHGFYISLHVILISSLALVFGFLRLPIIRLSHSTAAWMIFFVLILLQPFFSKIIYLDDHLLLSFLFVWCVLLSLAIRNLDSNQKKWAVHIMMIAIFVSAICNVLSQFGQLFFRESLAGLLIFGGTEDRLIGNVAQVNQAAYITTMGMASVFYFWYRFKKIAWQHWVFFSSVMLFFGVGLGFSASRGGLLLGIAALLSAGIFYQASIKKRMLMALAFFPVSIIGYQIGTVLMNTYQRDDLSAVGRWVGEQSLYLRGDLLEHALMAFKSSPITGVGFGNYKSFGLQNAEQVPWFTVVHHAHNFIAQIGAEMGLLGLVLLGYFAFILLKNLRFNLSPDKGVAYAILMLTFLYSLSEFPLWYARYLLLAVFFLAIVDSSEFSLKINYSKLCTVLSVLFVLGSCYYIKDYRIYSNVAYKVVDGEREIAMERMKKMPNTFGFGAYRDLTIYQLVPASEENLEQMIEMGNRVLSVHYDDFLILKQANMLVVVGESEQADAYFRALCLFSHGMFCQEVINNVHAIAEHDSKNKGYLERFEKWYVEKFNQPLPPKSIEDEVNNKE